MKQQLIYGDMKYLDWFYSVSCSGFGLLFVYAGITKLLEPRIFVTLIEAYGLVPESLLMPVAVALPVIEVLAGIGLLLNREGGFLAIAMLLILFIVILLYGIWMGLDVDCGCFGPQDPEGQAFHGLWQTLYRDVAMLAGIAWVYGWRRYRSIPPMNLMQLINKSEILRR